MFLVPLGWAGRAEATLFFQLHFYRTRTYRSISWAQHSYLHTPRRRCRREMRRPRTGQKRSSARVETRNTWRPKTPARSSPRPRASRRPRTRASRPSTCRRRPPPCRRTRSQEVDSACSRSSRGRCRRHSHLIRPASLVGRPPCLVGRAHPLARSICGPHGRRRATPSGGLGGGCGPSSTACGSARRGRDFCVPATFPVTMLPA